MKTLLIVRHAKSSHATPGQSDFDRPLSHSGKKDAENMAERVAKEINTIDLFIASSARRTRKTAVKFMKEYKVQKDHLQTELCLYESSMEEYYEVIENVSEDKQVVAIFGHNPGITYFANSLRCLNVFDMPTGSVLAVTFEADSWSEIRKSKRKLLFFYDPEEE